MQTEIRIATKEKQRNREEFEITQINGNNRPHYGNKHYSQFQNLVNLFPRLMPSNWEFSFLCLVIITEICRLVRNFYDRIMTLRNVFRILI